MIECPFSGVDDGIIWTVRLHVDRFRACSVDDDDGMDHD
jgi:hypothetical protein